NIAASTMPLGLGPVVDQGSPPAPAGYEWFGDPIVRAPSAPATGDGTFYLFGQIRSSGAEPWTYGLGFERGRAGAGAFISWDPPQILETFGTHSVNQRYVDALSMDVTPGTTLLHIGYINTLPNFGINKSTWHRRSLDGGATWGAPLPVGNDSSTAAGTPLIRCGPAANELTIFWHQFLGTTH